MFLLSQGAEPVADKHRTSQSFVRKGAGLPQTTPLLLENQQAGPRPERFQPLFSVVESAARKIITEAQNSNYGKQSRAQGRSQRSRQAITPASIREKEVSLGLHARLSWRCIRHTYCSHSAPNAAIGRDVAPDFTWHFGVSSASSFRMAIADKTEVAHIFQFDFVVGDNHVRIRKSRTARCHAAFENYTRPVLRSCRSIVHYSKP